MYHGKTSQNLDSTISGNGKGVATGITKINGRIIIVLDFEKIVTEVNPETGLKLSEIEAMGERSRIDYTILLAEDSPLLLEMLKKCLTKAGYSHLFQQPTDWKHGTLWTA